jgi:hypothetical protein
MTTPGGNDSLIRLMRIRLLELRPLTAVERPISGVNMHGVRRFNLEFEAIVNYGAQDLVKTCTVEVGTVVEALKSVRGYTPRTSLSLAWGGRIECTSQGDGCCVYCALIGRSRVTAHGLTMSVRCSFVPQSLNAATQRNLQYLNPSLQVY